MTGGSVVTTSQRSVFPEVPECSSSHAMFSLARTNMADDGESLESWLNKATSPSNRHEDWEYIMGFCDQINKELEGPQISVRLLAHKIQSPQEWEAMQALTVLEACLKNCGQRFHNEVGKFKFLNELIKLVSPKYLGDRTSEKVKTRVIEMLFSWTISLPEETKIREAYQMLKLQGIVLVDPEISADPTLKPPSSPRCKNPVFDDEKKSLQLAELLKSKKPEDLQEANRLIKNMVMEDEVRTRKAAQLRNTLEAANNSVKLLNEMLAHFNLEESTDEDKELIKELYNDCDKLQKKVFQLATESEDNDSHLGEILQASDDLSHVMNSYKMIVEGHKINGDSEGVQGKQTSVKQESASTNQSEVLIDLEDFDSEGASPSKQEPSSSTSLTDLLSGSITAHSCGLSAPSAAPSWLDEELLSLGIMVVVCCNLNLFLFFVLKLSCLFAEVGEPGPVLRDSAHRNQSRHLPSSQGFGPDLGLFDTSLSSAATLSDFPAELSSSASACRVTKTTAASSTSIPGLLFPTLPAFSSSELRAPTLQEPPCSAPTASEAAAAPLSLSVTLPAPPAAPSQLSALSGGVHLPSPPLSLTLQDLPMLDLSVSENRGGTIVSSASSTTAAIQRCSAPLSTKTAADDSPPLRSLSPVLPTTAIPAATGEEASLTSLFIPLEAIKPSQVSPVNVFDKNGLRVLLHFATNCPPGRPDVLVMVASMLNTSPQPVRNILLQAAVPKMMKVKLQSPSGTELAPFSPILPPPSITQVILLANPLKEKTRMRYKLTFTLEEQPLTEVGEVKEFPPADRWGAL
uniref:Golgi associated, gamma adaptin ear containing, ARF binding protein 3a n=1 Tax=Oryzias sinensis TaxID=183150 RepID=A0A8C7XME6_9TELE